jgi:hypothetical protein
VLWRMATQRVGVVDESGDGAALRGMV